MPKKTAASTIARHLWPMCRKPDRMNPRKANSSQIAGTTAISSTICQKPGTNWKRPSKALSWSPIG